MTVKRTAVKRNTTIRIFLMIFITAFASCRSMTIHQRAALGDLDGVKRDLSRGTKVDEVDPQLGLTPLMSALAAGKNDVALFLIGKEASVNAKDKGGMTPLHHALSRCNITASNKLIDKGADVNAKNMHGQTPLHYLAHCYDSADYVRSLYRTLGKKGADLNRADRSGNTPLLSAINNAQATAAKLLVEMGANVNTANKDSLDPLMLAARMNMTDVVKLLLGKGASVRARDKSGETALLNAVRSGNIEIVTLLVQKGADVKMKMPNGLSLLMYTTYNDADTVAAFIIKNDGKSVNSPDVNGMTPLMYAMHHGALKVAKLLIANGAYVNARDRYGNTAKKLLIKKAAGQILGNAQRARSRIFANPGNGYLNGGSMPNDNFRELLHIIESAGGY